MMEGEGRAANHGDRAEKDEMGLGAVDHKGGKSSVSGEYTP